MTDDSINAEPMQCADKLVFDSRTQAEGSAAAIAYQRGTKLKAYKCKHCNLWHLASDYDRER